MEKPPETWSRGQAEALQQAVDAIFNRAGESWSHLRSLVVVLLLSNNKIIMIKTLISVIMIFIL